LNQRRTHRRVWQGGAAVDTVPQQQVRVTQPPHIVVVEDDATLQELLATVLTDAGYTVVPWTQGAGAYEFIRLVQPDLVILDLWLEHAQAGSMVLGLLMVDPLLQHLPLIICSAYRQLLDAQAVHLRTHGYVILNKPYRMEELFAAMHALLGGAPARAVGA
jgi:DNA-binding response OmpR family regulator